MSERTFREAVLSALPNIFFTTNPDLGAQLREEWVDAILALPEMQALNGATFMAMTEPPFVRARQWCDDFLPDSVREWVIDPQGNSD